MSTEKSSQFDVNHWILRLIAYIIDSIIIGIIAYIIFFFAIIATVFTGGLFFVGFYFLLFFLFGILEVLYFVIMEVYWRGATFGKYFLGLQVQTENGNKVTLEKSFIRNISKILWIFLLIDWLLGIVIPGKDQRQKYTDRIAGTTVVSVKQTIFAATPQPAPPPPPPPPPP